MENQKVARKLSPIYVSLNDGERKGGRFLGYRYSGKFDEHKNEKIYAAFDTEQREVILIRAYGAMRNAILASGMDVGDYFDVQRDPNTKDARGKEYQAFSVWEHEEFQSSLKLPKNPLALPGPRDVGPEEYEPSAEDLQ